ncbi:MAG TPA: lipopolysaccharide biosynthesis protein [Candidatus Methanoperedens sp.]|nr:lipopolysaccharide biosynthesis protein [Candidatus Methanoperedens sp.]
MTGAAQGRAPVAPGFPGVAWHVGASVAGQGLHLILRLVLARLLAPQDFGLVAMALAVVSFTWWAQDLSLGQALIQRRTLSETEKSTAFWAAILVGCLVFAALAGITPLAAGFFKAEGLASILPAIGFSVVLAAPEATLSALLKREFRFKAVAVRQVGSVILGGGTGIALAFLGCGAWALVGDALVRALAASTLLLLQSPWRPALVFSGSALAELWGFSRALVGARLLNTLNRNIDTVLVGRLLGAGALGIYNLGYQFVLLPLAWISRAVNEVLFAALSRRQDDGAEFAATFAHALHLLTLVTFPLMTLIALAAPTLVPMVLGSRWEAAVPLLPFLCLAGAVQSLHSLIPGVLQARARANLVFLWVLASTVATTIAVVSGVAWGIQGVAVAYAAASVALSVVVMPLLFRRLGLRVADLAALVGRTGAFCCALFLAWRGVERLTGDAARAQPLAVLCLAGGAGAVVYLALCLWLDPLLKRVRSRPLAEALRLVRGEL